MPQYVSKIGPGVHGEGGKDVAFRNLGQDSFADRAAARKRESDSRQARDSGAVEEAREYRLRSGGRMSEERAWGGGVEVRD